MKAIKKIQKPEEEDNSIPLLDLNQSFIKNLLIKQKQKVTLLTLN